MLDFFKKIFYKKFFKPQKALIQLKQSQQTTAEVVDILNNRAVLKCEEFDIHFALKEEETQKTLKVGDNINILIKEMSLNDTNKIIGYDINMIKGE